VIEFEGNLDTQSVNDLFKPGWYPVRIDEVVAGQSKAGNPMLTITSTIMAGEGAARKVFWRHTFEGVGLLFLKRMLAASGIPWSVDGGKTRFEESQLIGKLLQVNIIQKKDKDTGETRNDYPNWKRIDAA